MVTKKPQNPRLNYRHPLASNLQVDLLLNEKGSTTARDLVTRKSWVLNGTAWVNKWGDVGIDVDASGEYARITDLTPMQQRQSHGRMTLEVEFSRDSGGSGTNYGGLAGYGNGTTYSDRRWAIENDNGDVGWGLAFQYWFSSQLGIWSIPYPSSNKKHHLVIVYDSSSTSTDPVFYLDGVKQSVTERISPSGTPRAGGAALAVGNLPEVGGAWDGVIYRYRQWSRLLSDREARSLYADPYQIYQKVSIFGKVASGTNYTRSVADNVSIVENLKRVFSFSRSRPESITTADSIIKTWQRVVALTELTSAADALRKVSANQRKQAELTSAADVIKKTSTLQRNQAELTNTTDAVRRVNEARRSQSEAVITADYLLMSLVKMVFASELIGAADSIKKTSSTERKQAELTTIADDLRRVASLQRNQAELTVITENVIRTLSFRRIPVESITASDSLSYLLSQIISVALSESVFVADVQRRVIQMTRPMAESINLQDFIDRIFNSSVALADTTILADAILRQLLLTRSLSDVQLVADAISFEIIAPSTGVDGGKAPIIESIIIRPFTNSSAVYEPYDDHKMYDTHTPYYSAQSNDIAPTTFK